MTLLSFSAQAATRPLVSDVRIADQQDFSRLVIDLNHVASYKTFTLTGPDRLVIDIKDGKWRGIKEGGKYKSVLVKEVRRGWPKSGILRVVLDLTGPVQIKDHFITKPSEGKKSYQLVVDIVPADTSVYQQEMDEVKLPQSMKKKITIPVISEREDKSIGRGQESERATRLGEADGVAQVSSRSIDKGEQEASQSHQPARPSLGEGRRPEPALSPRSGIPSRGQESERGISYNDSSPSFIPIPVPRPQKKIIVIDPGHGGIDPGAVGESGIKEKDITMQYAFALKEELEKYELYNVYLTRDSDRFIPLKKRVTKARTLKTDLFISLHADSNPDEDVRGLSVYTLSEKASDQHAAALAARENKADALNTVDLTKADDETADILIDLVKNGTMNNSAEFAETIVKELGSEAKLLQNTHRFAGFMVLTGIDVPSALVELGYLSNPYEERMLPDNEYRHKMVESIGKAINDYFDRHS